ncbi:MAG: hypothetical protein MUF51_03510, partial [Vicinamibacteria bacterium]|nr:hypothetical protein [Vicinamibacteria bacterium]
MRILALEENRMRPFPHTLRRKPLAAALALSALIGLGGCQFCAKPVKKDDTPSPAATVARFTAVTGSVQLKPWGQIEWIAARLAMLLSQGDLVRAHADSSAQITFLDETIVVVHPGGLVAIEEATADPGSTERRAGLSVKSGPVDFSTGSKVGNTRLSSPTVTLTHTEPTSGSLTVESNGASTVRLLRGRTSLSTRSGQSVTLEPNEAVKIDAAGQAGKKIVLPPAPTPLAPAQNGTVRRTTAQNAVLFTWEPVPQVKTYRLAIDKNAEFAKPSVYQVEGHPRAEIQGLAAGEYCWRIASFSDAGVEGAFTPPWCFTMIVDPAPAPLPDLEIGLFELRANILHIKGRTEPNAVVMVYNQRIDARDDGSFDEYIALEKSGQQLVTIEVKTKSGGLRREVRSIVVAE